MARKFTISRKLYELEKELDSNILFAHVFEGHDSAKVAAFDKVFSLTTGEQIRLFEYRLFLEKQRQKMSELIERYSVDEIARKLGFEDVDELGREIDMFKARRNLDSVNLSKIVSLATEDGQQSNRGRRLKAALQKLFNDDSSAFLDVVD